MKVLKILFLVIFNSYLYSNPINLEQNNHLINILVNSEVYIDESRSLTIDDIKTKDIKFKKNDKELLGFGYSPNFNVWIKFTLKNDSDKKIQRILEYDNSLTTDIEFYYSSNHYLKDGLFNISKERNSLAPIFKIDLEANQEKTYYLKVSSYITTLIVKLNLWETDSFYEKEIHHQLVLALFFGAMIILAFYNLFIYFFTRDISYLFYVFYIFGIILHHAIYVGFFINHLLDQSTIINIIKSASLLSTFPVYSLALFTKYFLRINQYKRINLILNIFLIVTPISAIFFIVNDQYNNYRNLLPVLFFAYLLIITIYATFRKNTQAYFILFGWFAIVLASIFMYLSSRGIFDVYEYYPYLIETAFILEAVIFSIALAYRIKELQYDKNMMNEKLIIQQRKEGERLKIQVSEKTKDLKEALDEKGLLLKELHHRVKNNMQMIISLIRLQADDIEDEKIHDIFVTIQNRIYAMSHLHELLYKQENISQINAYEYFDKMVDEIRESYNSEDIEIELDIKAQLEIEQAIYCGLILNELVTNSIKYGFDDKTGLIKVKLEKTDNQYKFHISDNGKGYTQKDEINSLGVLLVDTLVKKQLKGEVKIDTNNGVSVDIEWRGND